MHCTSAVSILLLSSAPPRALAPGLFHHGLLLLLAFCLDGRHVLLSCIGNGSFWVTFTQLFGVYVINAFFLCEPEQSPAFGSMIPALL